MKKMLVLGIMSGTSLGSVDYALCEIAGRRVRLESLWTVPYPKALQKRLHEAARGALTAWEFCQTHHDLGRFYARHAMRPNARLKPQLVGLHGQTVFHNPARRAPATFQLGEPAYLAETLRAPVVNNFRAADMAAGGQGAPLATVFHRFIFGQRGRHVCVNNLGGISNVTSMDWTGGGREPEILAFDTGPANMLMDFAMRHFSDGRLEFDKDGAWALRGTPDEKLLAEWLRHPYFRQKPPKSTGRELFGEPFFRKAVRSMAGRSKFDALATFTEFTARSLALNYRLHLGSAPERVILTGGGAANPALARSIETHLNRTRTGQSRIEVLDSASLDWPVEAIEPAAFALLAWLRFTRQPGNIPQTTGARRPVLCGQITEP